MSDVQEKLNGVLAGYRLLNIGETHPVVRTVRAIASNSKPNPKRLFVAEGYWLAKLALDNRLRVESLLIAPECVYTNECANLAAEMLPVAENAYTVSKKVFSRIAEKDKPDGILAICYMPEYRLEDLTFDDKAVVLVLDGIEIPGNMGTLVRVADGAGADAVFIVNRKARLTHPKFIHSTMGAAFHVPIVEFETPDACFDYLESKKFTVYLADSRAEKMYYELPLGKRVAFVMGSERYGISRTWYDKAVDYVAIPMLGQCDSLNVGVAGTVLLYEACVKNKLGGKRQPHVER